MSWNAKPPKNLNMLPDAADAVACWKRMFGKTRAWWDKPVGHRSDPVGWNSFWLPSWANVRPGEYSPGTPTHVLHAPVPLPWKGKHRYGRGTDLERWEAWTGKPHPTATP